MRDLKLHWILWPGGASWRRISCLTKAQMMACRHCWLSVHWVFMNKFQVNQVTKVFSHEKAFRNIVCKMPYFFRARFVKRDNSTFWAAQMGPDWYRILPCFLIAWQRMEIQVDTKDSLLYCLQWIFMHMPVALTYLFTAAYVRFLVELAIVQWNNFYPNKCSLKLRINWGTFILSAV